MMRQLWVSIALCPALLWITVAEAQQVNPLPAQTRRRASLVSTVEQRGAAWPANFLGARASDVAGVWSPGWRRTVEVGRGIHHPLERPC